MPIDSSKAPVHYREGSKATHAGCEILPEGKDIEIVIVSIDFKQTETVAGRTETNVWVANFAPNPYTKLPMILNATNRKRLVKLFPECQGYLNQLVNVAVRLTKEVCRDPNGGLTEGLRVSTIPARQPQVAAPTPAPAAQPQPAAQPEKKVLTADSVDKIVAWMKSKKKTIEDVKAAYVVPEEIENAIVDAMS
jgi:hypothetical protein